MAKGFTDPSELLKHEIAYCLGQMGHTSSIPVLIGVLEDTNQEAVVRHEAAEALAAFRQVEHLNLLLKYCEDECQEVAETCRIGVELLKWLSKESLVPFSKFESIDPAPPFTSTNIEELSSIYLNPKESMFVRYRALFSLRDLGTEEAVKIISKGFMDNSALFRHEVAFVFGQMKDPFSIPYLIEVLTNERENPMVRHEAAEALGASSLNQTTLQLLKEYSTEKHPRIVRESCLIALDIYEYDQSNEFEYVLDNSLLCQ